MSNTEQHLKRITHKLHQLVKEQVAIQKENNKLKEELIAAREKLSAQQKNAEDLKQQVTVLKLNTGEMSEVDKKQFEKRINDYVKEIDKCIAMLGE